ncbi:MAG: UvrD-helicase domain-containing protein [Candidatus Buchananbacteria bacterium]
MPDDYFSKLNPEQKKAVIHDQGPLLIVAGAGTGKTTVITQRLGWLIEQKKATGDQILALTFTDKAAGEMEERVDKLLPYGYLDLWIFTFHAFAEKILKENALEIGLPNDFKLLNQTQQWLLVRQNLDRFNLDYYKPMGNPTKFIHALIKLFSRAKDEAIAPQDYLKYAQDLKLNSDSADFIKDFLDPEITKSLTKKEKQELVASEIKKVQEVANAYHVYQQLLLENNALDFGDLINYCLQLFKKRPAVLAKYRQKFKYILVDEFQDTNYAQYELVKLLAAPQNNITVVGDDDQSIYKFRGASVSNILEFKKDYPKAEEIFLTQNYRSAQNILDLSYKFIQQNNPDRLEVKLAKTKTGKTANLTKKLTASGKEKAMILHWHFANIDDEVRAVLKQIVDLKEKDKKLAWSDFAILTRTNDAANFFVGAIAQTQIPYQFMASRGLYSKPVILDVLAYLKLLDNYHESSAMYRILSLPVFDLQTRDLANLNYWANRKGYSLYQTLEYISAWQNVDLETKEKMKHITGLIEKHSRLAAQGTVGQAIVAFLEDTGYLKALTKQDSTATNLAVSYLNQFYKKITEFENANDDKSVKNFLALIELELEAGEAGALENNFDEGPDSVKIMTVHAAKGLEFKYVFIVNLVDRRFPTDDRRDPIQLPEALIKEILPSGNAHLQEERRLFYVAMTRAKIGLFFTSAADCGGARAKKLSCFLQELKAIGFEIAEVKKETKARGLLDDQIKEIGLEIEKEDLEIMVPTRFSFTQLKAFETCPYQYRFAHILRVPVRGKAVFSFGKTIHATLQQFFDLVKQRAEAIQIDLFGNEVRDKKSEIRNQKPKVNLEELLAIYENTWIDDWYTSRKEQDEYKQKGRKALIEYFKTIENDLPIPKYLERPFNLKITTDGQEYTIKGVIDRIDVLDGGIEIIDYKTGQGKTEETFVSEDKEQLLIYQLAAQQVLSEKVKMLSFYYIEAGNKVSFLGTDKELEKLEQKIINTINEIKKGKFPPKPSKLCAWCDFRNICEFRAL